MDVFTRAIRGWSLSRSLDTDLTLAALRMAFTLCIPEIHHSDQGVQYAAQEYVDLLGKYHIQISMTAQGKPEENGYAERLMRTIKKEPLPLDTLAIIGHSTESHKLSGNYSRCVTIRVRWHVMDRMGWSSQRPQRRAFHRNEEAIVEWKKEVLPEIKKDS